MHGIAATAGPCLHTVASISILVGGYGADSEILNVAGWNRDVLAGTQNGTRILALATKPDEFFPTFRRRVALSAAAPGLLHLV